MKEAAKACVTFLYYNPRHTDAKISLSYHKRNKDVTEEDLEPLHTQPYVRILLLTFAAAAP